MGEKSSRRTTVYGGIALLLFVMLYAVSFRGFGEDKSPEQPQIVAFGDSVFGLFREDTAVTALLQDQLGQTVFNAGFGGTKASESDKKDRVGYPKDSMSLVGLTKAVLADDFGVQRGTAWRESNMEYFPEALDALEKIDFTQVKTVLIQHGFNDYHAGVLIENTENLYDTSTYLGALRGSVDALHRVNSDLRIVLVTPTYSWYKVIGKTCEESDFGGGVLEEYVNAQIRLAEEMQIEVVDLYHGLFEDTSWNGVDVYTGDGLHPNETGRMLMAERIAEVLQ